MTPVRSVKNQYLGLNAHLQSYLQASSDWPEFHTSHIDDMMRLMRAQLDPLGYVARIQQSLQIRRYGAPDYRPESDALIYDTDPYQRYRLQPAPTHSGAALVYSAPDFLEYVEEPARYHKAIAIYEVKNITDDDSEPVVWIELLSPSNKPGGQDSSYFQEKRQRLLDAGLVFVEIDYLHQQLSTFKRLPDYRHEQPDPEVSPYRIVVVDPRPDFKQGYAHLYPFHVDDPLPTVNIPLNGDDVLAFDFGPAYNKTFEEVLYGKQVDYSQPPVNFDRYREPDQARIVSRMIAVLEASQAGNDLEQPPQSIETLPLVEGLERLKALIPES